MGQKLLRFDGFYVCLEPQLIRYDEPHVIDFIDTQESYRENPVILLFFSEGYAGCFAMGQKTDVPIPYENIREFLIEDFLP